MTGPDGDNELDAFLARRSLLHRRFAEGDGVEPPAALDHIVLAKARAAIKRPSETPVYRAPQWALPVGLAASVLLVFAVVLNFMHVTKQQSPIVAGSPASAAPQVSMISESRERSVEAESSAPVPPALADAKAEADAAPPPVALANNERRLMKQSAGTARVEQQAKRDSGARSRDADAASAYISGASGALARNAAVGTPSEAAVPAAPPPAAEPAQQPAAGAASDSALLASTTPSRPTPAEEAARSDESKDTYTASTSAIPATSVLEEATVTGARRVRGGKRPAVPNAPAAVAMEKAKHPNPDQWLREIDVLRAAGRTADANRELEMFRRTYPDHSTQAPAADPQPPAQ